MFLCSLNHLKQHETLGITLDDQPLLVVFNDGQVKAYINRCPHLAIPLEWQENEFLDKGTDLIRCATHGALFLPDSGECVSGPCVGDRLTPVAIQIIDDDVLLKADAP